MNGSNLDEQHHPAWAIRGVSGRQGLQLFLAKLLQTLRQARHVITLEPEHGEAALGLPFCFHGRYRVQRIAARHRTLGIKLNRELDPGHIRQ